MPILSSTYHALQNLSNEVTVKVSPMLRDVTFPTLGPTNNQTAARSALRCSSPTQLDFSHRLRVCGELAAIATALPTRHG
jgi:hypothetical protein